MKIIPDVKWNIECEFYVITISSGNKVKVVTNNKEIFLGRIKHLSYDFLELESKSVGYVKINRNIIVDLETL